LEHSVCAFALLFCVMCDIYVYVRNSR